jgi:hypothetical protein
MVVGEKEAPALIINETKADRNTTRGKKCVFNSNNTFVEMKEGLRSTKHHQTPMPNATKKQSLSQKTTRLMF